jgi:hypothetical protein
LRAHSEPARKREKRKQSQCGNQSKARMGTRTRSVIRIRRRRSALRVRPRIGVVWVCSRVRIVWVCSRIRIVWIVGIRIIRSWIRVPRRVRSRSIWIGRVRIRVWSRVWACSRRGTIRIRRIRRCSGRCPIRIRRIRRRSRRCPIRIARIRSRAGSCWLILRSRRARLSRRSRTRSLPRIRRSRCSGLALRCPRLPRRSCLPRRTRASSRAASLTRARSRPTSARATTSPAGLRHDPRSAEKNYC